MDYPLTEKYQLKDLTFNIHCFNTIQQIDIMQRCREFMVTAAPGQPSYRHKLTCGSEVRITRVSSFVYNAYWKRREDLE